MDLPEGAVEFLRTREGVEAVITRIGFHNAQVILVAADGAWQRFVVSSVDQARRMCERLKVVSHEGYPDHIRQRMGAHRRPPEDWAEAPYPEQRRGGS